MARRRWQQGHSWFAAVLCVYAANVEPQRFVRDRVRSRDHGRVAAAVPRQVF